MSSKAHSDNTKKDIANKIDSSIDEIDNSIKGRFDALVHKLAIHTAKQAKTHGIPLVGLHVALGVTALAGGWLFFSAYMHARTGYYASEMPGMFASLAAGVALICVAQVCYQAAKILKNHEHLTVNTTESVTRRADTSMQSDHRKDNETRRPIGRAFITYAIAAILGLIIVLFPANSPLVWSIKQDGTLMLIVWGWIALNAAYAYYLFKGGHWRLSINDIPMSWLSVTINVALFYFIFIFRG